MVNSYSVDAACGTEVQVSGGGLAMYGACVESSDWSAWYYDAVSGS